MIVAIDGPAGAGKSTIASEISRLTGLFYLNTGNFYRALTLEAVNRKITPEQENLIIKLAENTDISIINSRIHLNSTEVEDFLHTDEVDRYVAQISAIKEVRVIINRKLHEVSRNLDIVAEGRDITTVVFPDADVKVYLDASLDQRARRRLDQGVSFKSYNEIMESIKERDCIDINKKFGGLKRAEDALYLNSSDLTINEVCEKVMAEIYKIRKQ